MEEQKTPNQNQTNSELVDRLIVDAKQLAEEGLSPNEIEEYMKPRVHALVKERGENLGALLFIKVVQELNKIVDEIKDSGLDLDFEDPDETNLPKD